MPKLETFVKKKGNHDISSSGDVRALCNWDDNKWDWGEVHLAVSGEYVGKIEFPYGENDDLEFTLPSIFDLIQGFYDGKKDKKQGKLYTFLKEKAEKTLKSFAPDSAQFGLFQEDNYMDVDVDHSYIYQVGVLKFKEFYFVGYRTDGKSDPVFLGRLKFQDTNIFLDIKKAMKANKGLESLLFEAWNSWSN